MLLNVTPTTRLKLVAARKDAQRGRLDATLSSLATLLEDPAIKASAYDSLAVRLLVAELRFLDEKDQEAFDELQRVTASLAETTSAEVELAVRRNFVNVATTLFESTSSRDFYALVDEQRLAGVELRDTTAVLDAKEAAEDGKHYDTLPALWAEYERTFRQGCWPIWRWAASNLAHECMQVGFLTNAAIFAIYSLDGQAAKKVGELLLVRGNRDEIKEVLSWITENALLLRHYTAACLLVAEIADAIQPDDVGRAFNWILRGCSRQPTNGFEQSRDIKAWECAEGLAPLLRAAEANELCDVAMSNCMWKSFCVHRPHLRSALGPCIPHLTPERLASLADNLAEQVHSTSKTEDDIITTINLLAYAVSRCDDETKNRIATVLFPSGTGLPWSLVVAAPKLLSGKALPVNWVKAAESLLSDLRHEVQHLEKGESPVPVTGSVMQHTENLPNGGTRLIHMSSYVPFQAAANYWNQISNESRLQLVDAVLDGVSNTFNLLRNRIFHVQLLSHVAEHISEGQRKRTFDVLNPLSRGTMATDLDEMSEEEANHPLNRYRVFGGTPAQLQAVAIQTLAKIEGAQPGSYGNNLNPIIAEGLKSSQEIVRRMSIWAWARTPSRKAIPALRILLATRESNLEVAGIALEAIAWTKGDTMSPKEFESLLDSCTLATSSPHIGFRAAAAYCLREVKESAPLKKLRKSVEELLHKFENDICFSVRRQTIATRESDAKD